MAHPVPLQSFLGGLSIPIPVHALTLLNGNVFGISGFCHRAVKGNVEGMAGVAGLVLGGSLVALIEGKAPAALSVPIAQVALSGFLVGLGTKVFETLAFPFNWCTQYHCFSCLMDARQGMFSLHFSGSSPTTPIQTHGLWTIASIVTVCQSVTILP